MKLPLGIWTVRSDAQALAQFLAAGLPATWAPGADQGPEGTSNREQFALSFAGYSGWVLIMTTGIAVRYLQGLLTEKQIDPGVVVVDEAGRHAIALTGGHEGGANDLAYRVANLLQAQPVITTATEALKPLVLGIGCRKLASASRIGEAVAAALHRQNRCLDQVREVVTIDLKLQEPGLMEWCRDHGLPLRAFRQESLRDRGWVSQPSAWVRETLGLDGVCEPCSLMADSRSLLLQPKLALDGVTVAIVEDPRQTTGARP